MELRRKLALVAGLYFVEGFPFGVVHRVWPAYFSYHDLPLAEIGWLSGLSLAYSAKFLWSPLVDRFGTFRRWILCALAAMALAQAFVSTQEPGVLTAWLWLGLAVFCLASATQDVAIDAYTIGLLEHGEEGPANGVRITAYRVALIASGGLLFLPDRIGWQGTLHVAAAVLALAALALAAAPSVKREDPRHESWWPAFRRWLSRPGMGLVLAFVLLYRLGDISMGPMLVPFWKERGATPAELGAVASTAGTAATIVGALAGGAFVRWRGLASGLLVLGALALLSNLGYAAAAAWPESGRPGLYGASVVESFCGGLASVAFLSFLMRVCEKEHAAVQYAALSALYALPGSFLGVLSGMATERIGFAAWFALTALLALPALALVPRLRRFADGDV